MSFGDTTAPEYECLFLLGTREVFRTRYNFQCDDWKEFQTGISRCVWRSPGWDLTKYGPWINSDPDSWKLRTFDTNKDGQFDREEATAASNYTRRLEHEFDWAEAEKRGEKLWPDPKKKEVTFLVVERTIVVPMPF